MYPKVEAWYQSGLSLSEYAQSIGMSKSAFEYWARKYRNAQKNKVGGFVEIFPTSSNSMEQNPLAQKVAAQPQGEIVFSFANGMSIKVSF
jgi:transposase-like protein